MNISLLNRPRELAGTAPADPTAEQTTQRANMLVDGIRASSSDLLAVAIIDIESGQALGSCSAEAVLKPGKADAFNVQVIKLKRQSLQALALQHESIEDVLITSREQLHLVRVSADGKCLLYPIVSPHDTNLAIACTAPAKRVAIELN